VKEGAVFLLAPLSRLLRWLARAEDRSGRVAATAKAKRKEAPETAAAASAARKEVLRIGLRETLLRNGIPASWVGLEPLRSIDRTGATGWHARLRLQQWDARLLDHLVPLEKDFLRRVWLLDGGRAEWLRGVSWQFVLPDTSSCPPLPHPGTWTAEPRPQPAPAVPSPGAMEAKVIAGPVTISDGAAADGVQRRFFARTEPSGLRPEDRPPPAP
jgi:hypothetical protein